MAFLNIFFSRNSKWVVCQQSDKTEKQIFELSEAVGVREDVVGDRVRVGRRLGLRGLRRLRRLLRLSLRLRGNFDDQPVRVLLPGLLVNVLDVADAGLLQREPPPADGAREVLLARVRQLVPLEHPPQVEAFITQVADELLGRLVLVAGLLLLLLLLLRSAASEVGRPSLVLVVVTRVRLKQKKNQYIELS